MVLRNLCTCKLIPIISMAKTKPVAKKAAQPVKRKVVAKATAPAVSKKQPSGSTAAQQIAAIDEQIAALEAKKATYKEQAIQELKARIVEANKVVRELENRLGEKPSGRRSRRPSITDEALIPQVHAAMSKFGGEGLNAKQLAERLNQDPLRVRKFISSNPKMLKREGKGPGTKFFLP